MKTTKTIITFAAIAIFLGAAIIGTIVFKIDAITYFAIFGITILCGILWLLLHKAIQKNTTLERNLQTYIHLAENSKDMI